MKQLTFGSLFAGCGTFDLGLDRAGMRGVWQCEIDERCRSVLHRHWPDVPQHDDVRTLNVSTEFVRPQLIVGGWPCQGNSVAGRRAGMADERSGLWGEVKRVLREFSPQWFLGENVPGILSVNGGRDWLAVLRDMAELGYGFAYRVLDAQWFGVPQRRRRVFIVGCLGDWRRAAEILFERDSLPWDSPPSREARPRVAASITAGTSSGSGVSKPGRRREDDVNTVVNCLDAHMGSGGPDDNAAQASHLIAAIRTANTGANGHGIAIDVSHTLDGANGQCIAHTLRSEGHDASEDGTGRGVPLVAGTLQANYGKKQGLDNQHIDGGCQMFAQTRSGVRRLTPRECERLQGLPDDWTRYDATGKELSDSKRYHMIGNAGAVPVLEWIGRRIVESCGDVPEADFGNTGNPQW